MLWAARLFGEDIPEKLSGSESFTDDVINNILALLEAEASPDPNAVLEILNVIEAGEDADTAPDNS